MSDVSTFLDAIEPARRKAEAAILDELFRNVTGWQPRFYQGGVLGYGRYDYTYASGHSGSTLATGFAPRNAKLSTYIMPGYTDFSDILGRLGKHTKGKSCLYLNKLADADLEVLGALIRAGLDDLAMHWPVQPT